MGLPSLLSVAELKMILAALREKYGPGHLKDVGILQAKLSMLLEAETRKEAREREPRR